jgi:hypothetical protein
MPAAAAIAAHLTRIEKPRSAQAFRQKMDAYGL